MTDCFDNMPEIIKPIKNDSANDSCNYESI